MIRIRFADISIVYYICTLFIRPIAQLVSTADPWSEVTSRISKMAVNLKFLGPMAQLVSSIPTHGREGRWPDQQNGP
jgi:hypothetical protein